MKVRQVPTILTFDVNDFNRSGNITVVYPNSI
jgi:hypothetical protein